MGEGAIQVFHVAKSRWGADDYSFILAIYLKECGTDSTPPYYRCPIQVDLDNLVPDRAQFLRVSNFEDSFWALPDRIAMIVDSVRDFAIPWFDTYATISALQRLVDCDYEALCAGKVRVFGSAYSYLRSLPGWGALKRDITPLP